MKRSLLLFITAISPLLLGIQGVFAFDISCPAPKPDPGNLKAESINGKIDSCVKARTQGNNEASLNASSDFYCPSGDFSKTDLRPLSSETIAYHISVSVFFSELDKEVLQYICKLRETRETNIIIASNDIRTTLDGTNTNTGLLNKYDEVCGFPFIQERINTKEKQWILTSETYPQAICKEIAMRKKEGWKNLAYMLMSDGAAKGYQNNKDAFIDKVKTKYDTLRDKFHGLLELLDKATSNLDALIKKTIK